MNEENRDSASHPKGVEDETVENLEGAASAGGDHSAHDHIEDDVIYNEDFSPQEWEQTLQKATQETEAWREKALRAVAEMENNRRRLEKDKEEYARYAHAGLIKALLPVVDNLSRAVQASSENAQDPQFGENLRKGVEMVAQEIKNIFAQHHVTLITPEKGEPFDPQLHEAMTEIRDENLPPSSIALVLEPGYQLHDRLLRPCRVAVNARDIHTKGQTVDVKS